MNAHIRGIGLVCANHGAQMGIHQIANGKWRIQVRKKGLPPIDKVRDTKAKAERYLEIEIAKYQRITPVGADSVISVRVTAPQNIRFATRLNICVFLDREQNCLPSYNVAC